MILRPGRVPLQTLERIYREPPRFRLDPDCHAAIRRSAARVAEVAGGADAVYGVNTGFGKLASVRIGASDVEGLQRNLIRSHASGVGAPLPPEVVRLVMALKLISLGRGASGVRLETVTLLEEMARREVLPVIPGQGSVGASGDLAPLAHLAAVLMGEGYALHEGEVVTGGEALRRAELAPVTFAAKEGLALINGTQVSTALALAGLFQAHRAACAALITGALSTDAAMGSSAPFHPRLHDLRGQRGQIEAAATLRALLEESEIRSSHLDGDERVQDPYCIRCQPQVDGACLDLLRMAASTLEIEANAVTDNPLVLETGEIVSGGNFHAEPVAFAADQTALAIAEIGAISQRRIAMLVDPALSFGLPPFLTPHAGMHSGLMVADIVSAALMSENKQRAVPASIDSTPTSANQEDHVSMATHAARRLLEMAENLFRIVGIEALTAAQGIDLRAPLRTSPELQRVHAVIRSRIDYLDEDRFLSPDLEAASDLVRSGALAEALATVSLPRLDGTHTSENDA